MIKQDILEKQVEYTYLALGSNLGDKRRNIETAKSLLINNKIFIDDISSYYETSSWPDKNLPKFYNIILKVKTNLSLVNLFKIVKNIEKKIGRKKAPRNYPRMCDIDIIDFKGLYLKTKLGNDFIETPHPRMTTRDFVLFPLYEIEKNWKHPLKKSKIQDLLGKLDNSSLYSIKQI